MTIAEAWASSIEEAQEFEWAEMGAVATATSGSWIRMEFSDGSALIVSGEDWGVGFTGVQCCCLDCGGRHEARCES